MYKSNEKNSGPTTGWLEDLTARSLLLAVLTSVFFSAVSAACMPASAGAIVSCVNEDLRSELGELFLPDCRAYEMVSPPYKEGYSVFITNFSTSSEKAILVSLANIDGSGDGETLLRGALYLDTRTPSGWRTSPLNAPSSEFVGEYPVAIEPVNGETLWEQHTPQEAITKLGLYARSGGANPLFRFIGPLNIPYEGEPTEPSTASLLVGEYLTKPVAATSDYDHVVLVGSRAHWPFDPTPSRRPSLYEYSATNNVEPTLIGVAGKEKGSTELVGLCGTFLGGSGTSYNALSRDGRAIFFTALPESACGAKAPASTEIYARLNGAMVDPGPAATIDVSANDCTELCGNASGKNFEGASEDGRRVFFTSTQKLTNDAVDGTASGEATKGLGCARPRDCNLYEYQFSLTEGPHPRLVAGVLNLIAGHEVLGVAGIAESGSRVYFVSRSEILSAGGNEFNRKPEGGQPNLYVYDTATGKTNFVALLGSGDEGDWTREFSGRTTEVGGESGQYLLFESSRQLTPDDTGEVNQLFEYDAETQELVRVTKGEAGYNENGNGVKVGVPQNLMSSSAQLLGGENDFKSLAPRLNMSADGRTVVFATGGRLSVRATSAEAESEDGPCLSLYEFHSAGPIADGFVRLVSDGRDTQVINGSACGAEFQAMDASGENIMFLSSDPLVPGDVDGGQLDIYDARVGGGFTVSEAQQPGACGTECEGVSGGAPVLPVATSANGSWEAPLPASPSRKQASTPKSHKLTKEKKKKIGNRRRRGRRRRSSVVSKRGGRR